MAHLEIRIFNMCAKLMIYIRHIDDVLKLTKNLHGIKKKLKAVFERNCSQIYLR